MIVDNKLMKYVLFKKRTCEEVRLKCKKLAYTEEYTEEVLAYLQEAGYIDDDLYVQKYIQFLVRLKKCSVWEMKMDLLRRGIAEDTIEKYMTNDLYKHEIESAMELAEKKYRSEENIDKVKRYLMNKGYLHSSVSKAIDKLKQISDNNYDR